MKTISGSILTVALAFFMQGCFTVRSNEHFIYQKLKPEQYEKLLTDSSNYYLIDVRTPGEYRKAHMEGARNYDFLAFHFGRDVDTLDRSRVAFVYCQTCHRSPFAARIMKHKGFCRVYDLKGGFAKWENAKRENEKDNKTKTIK